MGKVLKVDMTTLRRKKGKFARLCVEIDLSSPLPPLIMIDGEEQRVQYEGIHLICFFCGRYGHDSDNCAFKASQENGQKPAIEMTCKSINADGQRMDWCTMEGSSNEGKAKGSVANTEGTPELNGCAVQ